MIKRFFQLNRPVIEMAELLAPLLNSILIPAKEDRVCKDECTYCFDTPESENGLYISMCTNPFLAVGKQYVEAFSQQTGCHVYLHFKRIKRLIQKSDETEVKQPTRLAIGLEGGFDMGEKNCEIEELSSVIVMPGWQEVPLSYPGLPEKVLQSANAILSADSAARRAELEAMETTWDGEARSVSKFAHELLQLDEGKKVPPSGWKCEKCELTENLWLNLTDGSILCGRKNYDGSGGNNHAVEHYQFTNYPLAVKLGTINPTGGDVYSYAEDDMVLDPQLSQHLAHFGIDIMSMEKSDKTMAELELEMNQRYWEWSAIQETGSQLQPLYGPGLTGIHNLGNSCYMNAVMQVIMILPSFTAKYYDMAEQIFTSRPADPTTDFTVQMAKFARGLLSGDYSKEPLSADGVVPQSGIHPLMFRTLIGQGHREFSSKRQQDAHEFLLHLLTLVERNSRGSTNPTDSLKFRVEDRIECTQSYKVKYTYHDEFALSLGIPLEAAINKDELAAYEIAKTQAEAEGKSSKELETVRPKIHLNACVEAFTSSSLIDDFFSSAINGRTTAKKSTRFATFPDFLFLHMQKFTVGSDWVERKLDVSLEMPDVIDLSHLRGNGKQPNEEELPDTAITAPQIHIDESIVSQLVEMGFLRNACVKAAHFTKNAGVEMAMNWVMEHMDDRDFDAPLELQSAQQSSDEFMPDRDALALIEGMGFSRQQATLALKATDNNTERAVDWIFNHPDEMSWSTIETPSVAPPAPAQSQYIDGSGKYQLVAFISHMGTSTKAGHYVCHMLKNGQWVIFNDEKVALSEHPPKDLGYIYLYQRL